MYFKEGKTIDFNPIIILSWSLFDNFSIIVCILNTSYLITYLLCINYTLHKWLKCKFFWSLFFLLLKHNNHFSLFNHLLTNSKLTLDLIWKSRFACSDHEFLFSSPRLTRSWLRSTISLLIFQLLIYFRTAAIEKKSKIRSLSINFQTVFLYFWREKKYN